MTEEYQFIPINNQLNNFYDLLKDNNRLFFSAKFWDGKTTFLNEFKEHNENKYQIITLFPINYQIVDNKDIFELIKRDILLQLLMLEDIELEENDITFSRELFMYLNNNKTDLAEDLLIAVADLLSNIPFIPNTKEVFKRLFKNIDRFKTQKQEIEEKTNDIFKIDKFLDQSNVCIYEFDAISQLIYTLINKYREKVQKDIVLIIEDLDRIDPKHLFRLLNIFSAHFDRLNKGIDELDCNLKDNKFGFDKIVFVCDYDNIKNIFHHFYGNKTDFKGYITKFSSAQPFRYSLKKSFRNYIISILPERISQYESISNLLSEIIINKYSRKDSLNIDQESLRTIKENINLPPRIKKGYIYNKKNHLIRDFSINNLTILIDLLNRFDYTLNDFRTRLGDKTLEMEFISFVGKTWFLSEFIVIYNNGRVGFKKDINSNIYPVDLDNLNNLDNSYYEIMIQGISTVISRINESNIFLDDIIIPF